MEPAGVGEDDEFIGQSVQAFDRLCWCNWNGDNAAGRSAARNREKGRANAFARRESVVDDDDRFLMKVRNRIATAVIH